MFHCEMLPNGEISIHIHGTEVRLSAEEAEDLARLIQTALDERDESSMLPSPEFLEEVAREREESTDPLSFISDGSDEDETPHWDTPLGL